VETLGQGQGLEVRGQGQGLVNWFSRTRTFLGDNNTVSGVSQWQNVGLKLANFPWPAPDLHLMGELSSVGQLTRPTQPFILLEIDK